MTANANISTGRPPISAIKTSELLRQARHPLEAVGPGASLRALLLPQQLRQLGHVRRDPPRLVLGAKADGGFVATTGKRYL